MEEFPRVIPKKVDPMQQALYEANVTIEELKVALDDMANKKLPGLDGLPYEFYKATQDFISTPLLNVYKKAIMQGSIGEVINKENIHFIPKVEDPKLMSS